MFRYLSLLLSSILLAGCASKIDYNSSSLRLKIGMEKEEVASVMGAPRRTDVNQDRERWIYWNPVYYGFTLVDNENLAQDRLVVTFKDGKVDRWGKQTISDDVMEASQKTIESSYKAARELQKTAP